jgi:hypothetical protein
MDRKGDSGQAKQSNRKKSSLHRNLHGTLRKKQGRSPGASFAIGWRRGCPSGLSLRRGVARKHPRHAPNSPSISPPWQSMSGYPRSVGDKETMFGIFFDAGKTPTEARKRIQCYFTMLLRGSPSVLTRVRLSNSGVLIENRQTRVEAICLQVPRRRRNRSQDRRFARRR